MSDESDEVAWEICHPFFPGGVDADLSPEDVCVVCGMSIEHECHFQPEGVAEQLQRLRLAMPRIAAHAKRCPICGDAYSADEGAATPTCVAKGCLQRCLEFLSLEFPRFALVAAMAEGTATLTSTPEGEEAKATLEWALQKLVRVLAGKVPVKEF